MRRIDRGTLRSTGFVALLVVTLLTVTATTASAADSDGAGNAGGLLAPLDVTTSEGAHLSGYQLQADGGGVTDVTGQIQAMLLSGLFSLVRLVAGLACWLIDFAFRFPLLKALLQPAQHVADAYNTHVVGALGLKGLLLGWAFVFGLILFARGKVGKGLGEIVLTLLIAAFAASMFIRPDYLLGQDGPLNQAHQASLEVAEVTTDAHTGHSSSTEKDVTRQLQNTLTTALVVKPYQLLQYGQILDPSKASDKDAYADHLKWVRGGKDGYNDDGHCETLSPPPSQDLCKTSYPGFDGFVNDLNDDGNVGKSAALYAKSPSWDRVSAVILLLIAVTAIALMVISMCLMLLGTQAAAAGAAAVGGIAWVWGMLPGPSRMAVWRWCGVYIVAIMVQFVAAMALPLFGTAVDAVFSRSGPSELVERLLLLDAIAISFLAFHRRLSAATAQFGQRLALRMRYAKVGGTHLPGDTSELGAALAMNSPYIGGGGGGLLAGASGAHTRLLARHRLLGNVAAMADGTGMPFDPGRLLGDAAAEARRGLAPVALAAFGARGALRGAHWGLIGPKPRGEDESVKLLRSIADGVNGQDGESGTGYGSGSGASGKGLVVNHKTGEILHDPSRDGELLGSRLHATASRVRAYRIGSRIVRVGYGATLGLPSTLRSAGQTTSTFTEDARKQLRVSANQVRQDASAWGEVVNTPGQRLATFWQVHDPGSPVRKAARDAAVGAALFTSPSQASERGGGSPRERVESAESVNRRLIFDALMRLQRETWDKPPSWGGDKE